MIVPRENNNIRAPARGKSKPHSGVNATTVISTVERTEG